MATVDPKPLPERNLCVPEHRAEISFYEHMNEKLGDEYCVFCNNAEQFQTLRLRKEGRDRVNQMMSRGMPWSAPMLPGAW
jgi:hypothetical protein